MFKLKSNYEPTKAQKIVIDKLTQNAVNGNKHQVMLGVTGSGKTFVMANVIKNINKPTLVIAHNKTLAAQLYQEYRDYFPNNAVEYFVSYYDYYQPESYIPSTDTYIEKDSSINDEIDKLRLSTSTSLVTRKDVIVVASVSCIYNLGSPIEYQKQVIELKEGMKLRISDLLTRLAYLQYERNDFDFKRGSYRVKGDTIDINLAYVSYAIRLDILEDKLVSIKYFDPTTGSILSRETKIDGVGEKVLEDYLKSVINNSTLALIYPAKHYLLPEEMYKNGISDIKKDLEIRIKELESQNKKLESYRLKQRTNYDIEMIQELGYCKGIENYSRYFDGRKPGDAPNALLEYFNNDYLMIIDESHITLPQIRGMYNGDRARKQTLIDYGFRMPSCLDNRPLKFDEFLQKTNTVIYNSATPNEWELSMSRAINETGVTELLVRPTGILDPKITVLPTKNQINDLENRILDKIKAKNRVLVTTLTKRMAEELSSYFEEKGLKVAYLHSDVETLERSDILDSLRKGDYDVLIGINLLREGIDLPEVALVAILDADKEGFLRSETALIQVMGRAARHVDGEVVMYADNVTGSMERAISEVKRRRIIQKQYNLENDITPTSIHKPIRSRLIEKQVEDDISGTLPKIEDFEFKTLSKKAQKTIIKELEEKMKGLAKILDFENAAIARDKILELKKMSHYV